MPELAGHVRGIHPVTYLPPKIRLAVCNTRKPEREEKIGWMDSQEKHYHKFTMKYIGWKGNSVHKEVYHISLPTRIKWGSHRKSISLTWSKLTKTVPFRPCHNIHHVYCPVKTSSLMRHAPSISNKNHIHHSVTYQWPSFSEQYNRVKPHTKSKDWLWKPKWT